MQHKRINSAGKNALQKKAKVLPIFKLAYCYLWRKERWDAPPIFMAVYKLALRRAPVPSRLLAMCRKKIFITSPSLKKKEGICKRYFVILGTVEIYQQQKVNFLLVSY